ncbi:MAG: PDZ domain-containing protein [Acidobacteria bacterium]|nr:PDZ domain-containing protein [Acidobacteriota bacterium]
MTAAVLSLAIATSLVTVRAQGELPAAALPIVLLGVVVDSAVSANSTCLVRCTYSDGRRGTSTVGPGQNACDLAEVREILQDAVVVKNLLTNRLELLTFPGTHAAPRPQIATESPSAPTAEIPLAPPVVSRSADVVTVELGKDAVGHYLANLPDLLSSALATPRYRDAGNGQHAIDGFELGHIKEGSVVEQAGFKNGDVIVEFNGEPLDSVSTVIRLFGQAQVTAQAKLTVLRNSQRMTFVINTK